MVLSTVNSKSYNRTEWIFFFTCELREMKENLEENMKIKFRNF